MTLFESVLPHTLLAIWLALPLSLLLLAGLASWTRSDKRLTSAWNAAERLFIAWLPLSALVGVGLIAAPQHLAGAGSSIGVFPSGLAVWMAMMVGFIAWVILRYSRDYLRADPGFRTFLPWFLTTVASVLVLVLTDHLLVLAGAWIGVSLSLHQLLTLYPDRRQARLAAVQKFIASRLGDIAIVSAVVLIWQQFGTFRIPELYALAAATPTHSDTLTYASILLAIAAALKCAQIPFHGWLIRVMEAPTPVSALLHAGVINLGGFLWLRLFPVFDGFTAGHFLLLLVGGITALVAVFTMMAQTSVKHSLVWSTNAQMGFMLFEIGLGAYTLAFLHLLAHSLYKAHSFLAAGRTVKVSAIRFGGGVSKTSLSLALVCAAIAGALLWQLPGLVENKPVLGALLVMAVAAAALGTPGVSPLQTKLVAAAMALGLVPLYAALHGLVGPALPESSGFDMPFNAALVASLIVAILGLWSLAVLLAPGAGWMARLHWPASQGFYLDRPFEQFTRFWAQRWLTPKASRSDHPIYRLSSGEHS
ncbi:MAG: NADH-quinone oxidoreductase subunit L [Marinobacter sp. 34-60-7]|nr:MAG: NADH-quinone oxidoreductase subunit L [Marinobacter sp. 34-60-7]